MSKHKTHAEQGTVTAASGSASATINAGHNMLHQIFVKADTVTTTFDVTLTDAYSNVTLTRASNTGELNELLVMPAYSNWTLGIANASVDEDFTYVLAFREA